MRIQKKRNFQRFSIMTTVFLMVVAITGIVVGNTSIQVSAFSGSGDGTTAAPFVITTCEQLQEMNDDLEAAYVLGSDIDCSETLNWNEGAGFIPIAQSGALNFIGHFDGQGHTISDLYINTTITHAGLFGQLRSPSANMVGNVTLQNVVIKGKDRVGAFVGYSYGATLKDIDIINTEVEGTGANVGGLAGYVYRGTLERNMFNGSVTGTTAVGGLAGYQLQARFVENASSAAVVGNREVGGIVGHYRGNQLEDSYSTGSVTGIEQIGGLAGIINSSSGNVIITNNYSTATITATGTSAFAGGLIGKVDLDGAGGETTWFTNNIAANTVAADSQSGVVIGGVVSPLYNRTVKLEDTYYMASHTNLDTCIGGVAENQCTPIANDSYFYNYKNAPYTTSCTARWSQSTWYFNGTSLPVFQGGQGSSVSIDTPPEPVTINASALQANRATLNGETLVSCGSTASVQGFVYDTTSHGVNPGNVVPAASSYGSVAAVSSPTAGAYTLTEEALAPNTTYYYRAYAGNGAGMAYGEEQSFTTLAAQNPTMLSPVSNTVTSTTISLSLNLTTEALSGSHRVTFQNSNNTVTLLLDNLVLGDNELSIDVNDLLSSDGVASVSDSQTTIPGGSYTVIYSYRDISDTVTLSATSTNVTVLGAPTAPSGITLSSVTEGQVDVKWVAPVNNGGQAVSDYIVQYRQLGDVTWIPFEDGVSDETEATITGLTKAVTYEVRVIADNGFATSVASDEKSITVYLASTAGTEGQNLFNGMIVSKRPSFFGVATPGSNILVTVYSDPITCNATADILGNWDCTLPSDLSSGEHTVYIQVTQPSGAVSELGPYAIEVESEATVIGSPNTGYNPSSLVDMIVSLVVGAVLAIVTAGILYVRKATKTQ